MYLQNLSMIRTRDELFHVSKTIGFRISVNQFGVDVRFASLLSCHLQETNGVFPVI